MRTFKTKSEIKSEIRSIKDSTIINLLKVIIGELDRLPTREEPTEDQIYSVIKKMYESAIIMNSTEEINYLKQFIKQSLTEQQLTTIIEEAIQNNSIHNIGEAMKYLKTNYPNQYDGKIASSIIKTLFNKN